MNLPEDKSALIKPFREGLFRLTGEDSGYLVGNRCTRCNITFFPGRGFCSNCIQKDKMEEVPLSRKGILYSYTTVYQGKPGLRTPYSVGFIDLAEGVRVFAPLFDILPEALKVGMEMELAFKKISGVAGPEEALVYGFQPVGKGV